MSLGNIFANASSPANRGKNMSALHHYLSLPQGSAIQAEYIWIGGTGEDLRSKTKTLTKPIKSISDLPEWNFDGSSTGQADGHYSEIWLRPVKYVIDPFRGAPNVLVLCECLDAKTMQPIDTNRRANAAPIFNQKKVIVEEPWFGIEQEYTLFESDGKTPLGWPRHGFPAPQGPYYCGVGTRNAYGRQVADSHYSACLYSGLNISGINAEVMPGQWEFQVGPCLGIDSGDQLWLTRYILERIAEDFNVCVSFDAKPIKGDWNGAGLHTNYSTKSMRIKPSNYEKIRKQRLNQHLESKENNSNSKQNKKEETLEAANKVADQIVESQSNSNLKDDESSEELIVSKIGYDAILTAIGKLAYAHGEHMKLYGKDNQDRMTGRHETAKYDEFSFGVANRAASVRIPRMVEIDGCGYFEDRRPAANADPYDVTAKIVETTLLK